VELTENGNIALYWRVLGRVASFESEGADAVRYDALCAKYNDLNYNKKTRYIKGIHCRTYSSNEIASIDVASNVDFDTEHSAGSSLGDIVRLLSASPIKFIQSGYKETFDWNIQSPSVFKRESAFAFCYDDDGPADIHHRPVHGLLTELTQEDMQLMGEGSYRHGYPNVTPPAHNPGSGYFFGYLIFEKEPEEPGVIELTVTIRLADGRMLSQKIEKRFE
jgi:hypothetical protein